MTRTAAIRAAIATAARGHPTATHSSPASQPSSAASAAAAFASGLAANMAVLELLSAGDRLVAPLEAYYGSLKQFVEQS